jgi:3-(3-hydroxy-phenyl)propionate hydroxylase
MTERATVAVVGAGPTGVTAATLLAQQGVDVLVLDRYPDVFPRPRAVHLDDEVYRILARMGVGAEFAAISRPAKGLRLLDADSRVLAEFARSTAAGIHGFPQASMFDQPELERLLRANLARRPSARLRGNVEVTGIVRHAMAGHGRVTVELTDLATGRSDAVLADYVLGCDGANSAVRDAIGVRMAGLGFEQRWLVVDIATDTDLGQWDGVHQVCSPRRAATYMRIGADRYRFEFQLLDGESTADFSSVPALQPLLRPWIGADPTRVGLQLVRVAEYTFQARVAQRWRAGPIFLLGDAAHLSPPFIGQGLGAGLRDAANLAWKLTAVLRGVLPESDLDSYQAERRPHARTMIRRAMAIGWVMTGAGRAGDLLRSTLLPRIHRLPGIERIIESPTPPLRRSTLVRPAPLRRGLAGRLCPNAVLEPSGRFDDRAGGRFALLTDLPVGPDALRAAEQADVTVLRVDPSDRLGQWLASGDARAALVRPDGTVLVAASTIGRAMAPLLAARRRSRAAGSRRPDSAGAAVRRP